ncbi:hypothetical protein E2562_034358 [Oryza meyeriana var. granulata]|uniref:DUF834 domain-containing protein n=1 Tax=Oryza meyeriana var. granulata TaxID=110450 RepID=A0A6G1FF04_9ORYZ|nr:hypothetical protein E2562_034358 [Oryza meyeriana var. granulata]
MANNVEAGGIRQVAQSRGASELGARDQDSQPRGATELGVQGLDDGHPAVPRLGAGGTRSPPAKKRKVGLAAEERPFACLQWGFTGPRPK